MEATLDPAAHQSPSRSHARLWAGRVLGGIPTLFMVFDGAMKVAHVAPVREASAQLGFPDHLNPALGVVVLALVLLSVVPRTAVLGTVLMTGYLGGAVAIHLRLEDPLFSHTLFPVYVGALLWCGLLLRDARVQNLFANR